MHATLGGPEICVQGEPTISKGAKKKDETSDMQQNFLTCGLGLAMGTRLAIQGPHTHGYVLLSGRRRDWACRADKEDICNFQMCNKTIWSKHALTQPRMEKLDNIPKVLRSRFYWLLEIAYVKFDVLQICNKSLRVELPTWS